MRGYSNMSDKERKSIIKQHSQVYDGYSIGNVPSNMTPLTVYDSIGDKEGITVTNKGEVKKYTNNNINKPKTMNSHHDEPDQYQFNGYGENIKNHSDFEELGEEDIDWDEVKNPEVENVMDITEEVNKSLSMFKRFKKYN